MNLRTYSSLNISCSTRKADTLIERLISLFIYLLGINALFICVFADLLTYFGFTCLLRLCSKHNAL